MPTNTTKLQLYKADPLTDGSNTFNLETMLNDNWDKVDEFAQNLVKTTISTIQPTNPRINDIWIDLND